VLGHVGLDARGDRVVDGADDLDGDAVLAHE
jgi:hypothetical protein